MNEYKITRNNSWQERTELLSLSTLSTINTFQFCRLFNFSNVRTFVLIKVKNRVEIVEGQKHLKRK